MDISNSILFSRNCLPASFLRLETSEDEEAGPDVKEESQKPTFCFKVPMTNLKTLTQFILVQRSLIVGLRGSGTLEPRFRL